MRELHFPTLSVPADCFTDATDPTLHPPGSRLLCTIVINGCPMHLDAREVVEVDGVQTFVAWAEDADLLSDALGADGRWHTTTIDGREYALFASPHC